MTTDPQNTITRSGLKLHPEHAASGTNHSKKPSPVQLNASTELHALQPMQWCGSQADMPVDSQTHSESSQDCDRLTPNSGLEEEYAALSGLAHNRVKALKSQIPIAVAALCAGLAGVVLLPPPLQALVMAALPLALIWVCHTTLRQVKSLDHTLWQMKCLEWFAKTPLGERPTHCGDSVVDTLLTVAIVFLVACACVAAVVAQAPEEWWVSYLGFVLLVGLSLLIGLVRYHADRIRRHRPQ